MGRLEHDRPTRSFLIHSEQLETTNHQTIGKCFNNAMEVLWPGGIKYENVLLLVTDNAAYMGKAARSLQDVLYTNLTHVTCIAHALDRVCEAIQLLHPTTNSLISFTKKIFRKAPKRTQMFRELCPDTPLPPSPIFTRWGTWLEAAEYYAKRLDKIELVIKSLPNKDKKSGSAFIKIAQALFEGDKRWQLIQELTNIKQHYVHVRHSITQLETEGQLLTDSISILSKLVGKLSSAPDEKIKKKMANVLDKNNGLKALSAIASMDISKIKTYARFHNFSPQQFAAFKYAPIVSCCVERSFSSYKRVLRDNRRRFTFENLKMHLIISCYNSMNKYSDDNDDEDDDDEYTE